MPPVKHVWDWRRIISCMGPLTSSSVIHSSRRTLCTPHRSWIVGDRRCVPRARALIDHDRVPHRQLSQSMDTEVWNSSAYYHDQTKASGSVNTKHPHRGLSNHHTYNLYRIMTSVAVECYDRVTSSRPCYVSSRNRLLITNHIFKLLLLLW